MFVSRLSSFVVHREVMIKQFSDFYDYYVEICTENLNKDGQQMTVKSNRLRNVLFNQNFSLGSVRRSSWFI